MRIAIITDSLSGLGGTETLTARMAMSLRDRGHDPRVFCPRSPSNRTWLRVLRAARVPVLVGAPEALFPDDRGARDRAAREALLDRITVRVLVTAFARWNPDVIVANPMGPLLVAWLRSGRLPIAVVGYEFSAADHRSAHWYPPELPTVINRLDAVMAGCEASRRGVIDHHRFVGRTEVVPPLVVPVTRIPALPSTPWNIGCIARLCVEKGLDYLLAALPRIRERHPRVTLRIYGEGYDRTRLTDLARALSVNDVVVLAGGFDPVRGLNALSAAHSIFVQPSLYESIPTAMLEVAARGRVIVASEVGGIPEFFAAGAQGAMVRPADPAGIAEATSAILDNKAALAKLGERNAAVVAERYGYQDTVVKLEDTLRSAARC